MKKRFWKLFIAVTVISTFLLTGFISIAGAEVSTKTFKFRFQHWQPTSSGTYKLFIGPKGFPAMVERASGGRIKIETFPGGALFTNTDVIRAVGNGSVDMSGATFAYGGALGPHLAPMYGLPFALENMEDAEIVWRETGLLDYIREEWKKKHNLFIIGLQHESPVGIFSKKPIRKLADFKGLKIRAVGVFGSFYTSLGASAIATPGSEIYMALDRGVVDAVSFGSESAMIDIGLAEVSKYVFVPWISGATIGDYVMNLDKWNSLPPDLQQIMVSCMEDWANIVGTYYRYQSLLARETSVKKYKMQITTLPEADLLLLKQKAVVFMNDYAKRSPEAAKIMKFYTDYLALKKGEVKK